MIDIYKQVAEIFVEPRVDLDDEYDDDNEETNDNEQPDTTGMSGLESEKSTEQESQEGQGLKISTQIKCLVDYQLL